MPAAAGVKPDGAAGAPGSVGETRAYKERWSVIAEAVTVATVAANSAAVSMVVSSVITPPDEFLYVIVLDSGIQFCKLSSQ